VLLFGEEELRSSARAMANTAAKRTSIEKDDDDEKRGDAIFFSIFSSASEQGGSDFVKMCGLDGGHPNLTKLS